MSREEGDGYGGCYWPWVRGETRQGVRQGEEGGEQMIYRPAQWGIVQVLQPGELTCTTERECVAGLQLPPSKSSSGSLAPSLSLSLPHTSTGESEKPNKANKSLLSCDAEQTNFMVKLRLSLFPPDSIHLRAHTLHSHAVLSISLN